MAEDGGSKPEKDEQRQGMEPRSAVLPISMMVTLIVITVGIALFIGPVYRDMGLSAEEEYSSNPYMILIFVVMLVVISAGILLLRKIFKRKNKRVMKIVLSIAMAFAMLSVLTPLIDVAVHGVPPHITSEEFEREGVLATYPVDPTGPDDRFLLVRNDSISTYEAGGGGDILDTLEDLEQISVYMDSNGRCSVAATRAGKLNILTPERDGSISIEVLNYTTPGIPHAGSQIVRDDYERDYLLSIWKGDNESSITAIGLDENGPPIEMTNVSGVDQIPSTSLAWGGSNPLLFSGDTVFRAKINSSSSSLELETYHSFDREIRWMRQFGEELLLGGTSKLWHITENSTETLEGFRVAGPSLITLSEKGGRSEILLIDGSHLYSIIIEEGVYNTDGKWGLGDQSATGIHSAEPLGKTYIADDGSLFHGVLDREERMNTPVSVAALLITVILMGILIKIPKWYIIDLVGILVGAGVLAFLGISIPIYLLMILMILLAVYDFISVYITKHMIALAETVVEAKLPILLVFPKKLGYKYEEKKDLMESKKRGESMFMGLGDVIIPGSLPVSASVFLDPAGAPDLLGFIAPPTAVGLFALAGMLIGFSALMALVIRGKAHAGLPFLNTGTILGFLIGHLIVYGNLILF